MGSVPGRLRQFPFAFQERETLAPNLLVLCADHGMSEAGGHGASSAEEVNTPLILVSSAFGRKPGENAGPFNLSEPYSTCLLSSGCDFKNRFVSCF